MDADLFIAGGALSGPDAFIKLSEKKLQTIPATATITLVAKVQNYAGKVGDSADRCLAIAAGVKPVATESVQTRRARLSYALLHEIGHGLKLAAKDARIKELDGRDKNPLLYEYDGPHCAAGIPDSARTKDPPYVGADKKLLVGACVLYSPTSPGTPYGQVNKYCPDCLTHLKGMQLGIFRPPGGGTPVSDFPGVDRVTRY